MAKFRIISKDGTTVRYEGCPRYSGSYMGVPALDFSEITSPVPIAWEIGDYVDYRNGRYYLYSLPEPKKQARRGEYGAAFVYSGVQFHSPVKDFEIALFRDIVTEDNKIHFSTMPEVNTYEDVPGIARRIQACMDDIFPGKWRIDVYDGYDNDLDNLLHEVKEFSLSGGTCLDALSLIYDIWTNVGWVYATDRGKPVIVIGRANVRDEGNTTLSFSYGKGNGLTAIKRASANKEEFATRLYVYGSDRNLPPRYYNSKDIKDAESVNIPNLMLPIETWGTTDGLPDPRLAYLEADENIIRKYGLIPRVIRFDGTEREEIYPSIEGLTEARVRQAMIDLGFGNSKYLPSDTQQRIDEVYDSEVPQGKGTMIKPDGTPIDDSELPTANFTLVLHGLGFGLDEQAILANEKNAIVSMKSGKCAGREFVVKSSSWAHASGTYTLKMERLYDESLNRYFPNDDYPIVQGDKFVILDIAMPEYYVTLAQERMYEEGIKVLADYTRTSAYYEPQIDAKALYESKAAIREGMYMKVVDEDVVETESKEDYVIIDSLSIDEKTEIPTYSVTLREQKRAARGFAALEDMVEDAKEGSSKEVEEVRKMTQRRFASTLDTISMLQGAMANFTEGINPVAVQTMAMLVGDESLQFKFTSAAGTTTLKLPVTYDAGARILKISRSYRLWHMTLGIDSVTSPSGRSDDDYLKWTMPAWESDVLAVGSKGYYLYAKVPKDGTSGNYLLSESTIAMESETGYYHLLVGILNREYDGTREFVSLYGFTEVLPGQITTDVIRSADGNSVLDLVNGLLTFGAMVGLSGQTAAEGENLRIWAGKGEAERDDAPFRVYDNGSVYASLLHLLNGCRIGNAIQIEDGKMVIDIPDNNAKVKISEDGIIAEGFCTAAIGHCGGAGVQGFANGSVLSCPNVDDGVGVQGEAKNGGYAFYSTGGKFGGLRPNTRVINSGGAVDSREVLMELDFSVLVYLSSGVCYLRLPSTPQDGQEYHIETHGATLNIIASHPTWMSKTKSVAYANTAFTHDGSGILRLKFYKQVNQWQCTTI